MTSPSSPSGIRELAPRVLIVEDTADLRGLFATELEHAGFVVFHAPDGTTGLKKARECRPRVVVLDLMLPDLNGLAVAHALRHELGEDAVRIVVVTALGSSGIRRAAEAAGCDAFLTKPVTAATVVEAVRRLTALAKIPARLG